MRGRWTLLLLLSLAILPVAVTGCKSGGTSGGTQGTGSTSKSLELETVAQWLQSAHSRPVTFAAEEDGCKNCHDGQTFTETGGGFQPRMSASTTSSTEGSSTPRDWVVATDCRCCHTPVGTQIASDGKIQGVPSLDQAEGGRGALCMACHNGWHAAGPGRSGNAAAPHSSVQTDMLFGVNTLQVGSAVPSATASQEESISPHAKKVPDTCVGCHMWGSPPNHLFRITDFKGCERKGCHKQDMTDGGISPEDFDGNGTKDKVTAEVQGLMDKLKAAINKKAGSTDFKSERGNVVFVGSTVPTSSPAYAAAYNYFFVTNDRSKGIHNFQFTVRLLQQSIDGVSQ